jgi:hypothetical protein
VLGGTLIALKKLILLAALAMAATMLSAPAEARHLAKPVHHVTPPKHGVSKHVAGKHPARLHGSKHAPPSHGVPKHPAPKRAPTRPAAPAIPAPPIDATPMLSDFADLVFDGIVGENAPELDLDFAAGTVLGSMPLVFEKTKLGDIQASYGGTLHAQGDGGSGVTWLCYTQHAATRSDTPVTAWFTASNAAADAAHTLSMVVVENVDASRADGCTTAPPEFSFPAFGVPGIGASPKQLAAKFGPVTRDRQGNVYLNSTRPLNDGSGQSVYQTLGYLMNRSGTVLGIALSQLTTD